MSKTKTIFRDVAKFTISGYVSNICNFLSATIVRRILDPFFMGIYSELLIIFEYAKYNHFGMLDALDRQIPYYNGKKEFDKVEAIKNIAISFSIVLSITCSVLLIGISLVFKNSMSPVNAMGLKVIAIMLILQTLSTFYISVVRAYHLFTPLSWYVIAVAVFDILFKTVLGIKFGVMGILWATVITMALGLVYLAVKTKIKFKVSFNISKDLAKGLLRIGFPLLLSGFCFMALRSVDRIMIITFLTKEELGLYSIAVMVHSFVFQLPNLIYAVLFPRFYEAFGTSEQIHKLKGFLEKPTFAFSCLFPILIGIGVILLPVFVNYILPKYLNGVVPAYILLFATFFLSLTYMSGYLLIALKKQDALVIIGALSIVICVALDLIFIKIFNLGINGIALGVFFTYFLYSLLIIGYATRQYMSSISERLVFLVNIYSPILWVMAIVSIFKLVFHYDFKNIGQDVLSALIQTIIFLFLSLPLVFSADKKIELFNRIKNANITFYKQ